jgi:hypothetical protein
MLVPRMDFSQIVATSERVAWTLEKVTGEQSLDLSKRFLPESLACVEPLACLSAGEKHTLNQIRGHSYAYLFYFIEECILAAVLAQLKSTRGRDEDRLRALLRFADEEVKHQQMFKRVCALYRSQSGIECGLLEARATAEDVAATVMKNSPLAVYLTVLHIEWVSQRHFVECMRDSSEDLDPLFTNMLKVHWLEEAQHTKVDLLVIQKLVDTATEAEIDTAVDDYLELGKAIDGLLYQQMELDVATLETAIGRKLSDQDRDHILVTQATACRRAFLWMGMTNPAFIEFLGELSESGAKKVADVASSMAV